MRAKSARGVIISAMLLCLVAWLARYRLYELLELRPMVEPSMYIQVLGMVCIFTVALVAVLVQTGAQPAQTETQSINSPALSKDIEELKETLSELGEKVTDLHAMSLIKQKRQEDKH